MENKTFLAACFTTDVKTATDNFSDKPQMDERAALIMECFERKVSPTLFNTLGEMVYGFRKEVQRKMAACLKNYVCSRVATTTGYAAVDTVLEICYVLIGAERKKVKKDITNSLVASKLIELQERKAKKEELARISVEIPRVKNGCGIEIRKCCLTCKNRCEDCENCQMCRLLGVKVAAKDLCSSWKMAECYQQVGRNKGKIKKKEYLMFVLAQREEEAEAIEQGILMEEDCKTAEELRAMFEEGFGSIYAE